MIGISGSLIWSKTLNKLIFSPCGEFRWSPEGPVSQIHSPHLHVGAPGIISGLVRSVQMLKREWVRKETGCYRTYSSLVKLQHWFLSLGWKTCLHQNCSLSSCACSEGPSLRQNTLMMILTFFPFSFLFWLPFPGYCGPAFTSLCRGPYIVRLVGIIIFRGKSGGRWWTLSDLYGVKRSVE